MVSFITHAADPAVLDTFCVTLRSIIKIILKNPTQLIFTEFAVFDIIQVCIKTLLLLYNKNKSPIFKQINHLYSTRNLTKVGGVLRKLANSIFKSRSFYLTHTFCTETYIQKKTF